MGLETTTTIDGLNSSWPVTADSRIQGDDHIRQIKQVLKSTFPGTTGNGFSVPIAATETELNYVDGVTGPIQEQLDAKAPLASPTFTGVPIVPNATVGTNSGQIASTNFVHTQIAATALQADTSAKAWGELSTTGTIYNSYGVASITDVGVGIVLVTLSNAFSSSRYVVTTGAHFTDPSTVRVVIASTTQFYLYHYQINLDGLHDVYTLADPTAWHFACFGDLA